jgi:ubiquinol-cytochrome c reductase subunit 7
MAGVFRSTRQSAFLMKPLAKWYQGLVFNRLAEYGMRYEDLLIEDDDLYKAHAWADKETMAMRDRRIKRAVDMSMKHTHLPKEIAALQDPGNFYLSEHMQEAKKLREEREMIQG